MKVKREFEQSRPELRSAAAKRMSRPDKLAKLDRGFAKLQKLYASRGLLIGP